MSEALQRGVGKCLFGEVASASAGMGCADPCLEQGLEGVLGRSGFPAADGEVGALVRREAAGAFCQEVFIWCE